LDTRSLDTHSFGPNAIISLCAVSMNRSRGVSIYGRSVMLLSPWSAILSNRGKGSFP
jgi:hypothetical protein